MGWPYALTIISNVAFVYPASVAAERGRWTRFMVYLMIWLWSSLYHACNSFSGGCLLPAPLHRTMDFFFAQFIIIMKVLYLIDFGEENAKWERILLIASGCLLFVVQYAVGDSLYIQMGICCVCLLVLVGYWIWYAVRFQSGLPPYDWSMLGLGVGFTCVACGLFATQSQYHGLYWAIHSCWHVNAAIGQALLLQARSPSKNYHLKSLDTRIRSQQLIRHSTPATQY